MKRKGTKEVRRKVTDIRQWLHTSRPRKTIISLRSIFSFGSLHVSNHLGLDLRLIPGWSSQTAITLQETSVVMREMVSYVVEFMF